MIEVAGVFFAMGRWCPLSGC